MTNDTAYGTADRDAPVSRADFERALRHLNTSDVELRDGVIQLAARFVALVDELVRRIDGVEPDPAPPDTPARPAEGTVEIAVARGFAEALVNTRAGDAAQVTRAQLDLANTDKYAVTPSAPPCDELLHLCKARCCTFSFPLSTQDLDEGVIRWDYGQPYLIRQRESDGYCVHSDPDRHTCSVHAHRPRVCRLYDCRDDKRIWIDYEHRIPNPGPTPKEPETGFDLLERARRRAAAALAEKKAISNTFADAGPTRGPKPTPR
jgi:Fe-S-cluster containining protein